MSAVHDELKKLQDAAVAIAAQEDVTIRHKGGMWLEYQCRQFEEQFRPLDDLSIEREVKIEFMAVLKILFDAILVDALEDMDWSTTVPTMGTEDVQKILRSK